MHNRLSDQSRLPHVGTTIFTVMSRLAAEVGALNLSQGFPSFPTDPALLDRVTAALRAGHNQYAPMAGVPQLREAISQKTAENYGSFYDPETEITITSGATEALFAAITALVRPDSGNGPDEVIVLEPAYDSYVPAIELAGGVPVFVPLIPPGPDSAGYALDWNRIAESLTDRTRLILVNTPHNPTGLVWTAADLERLSALVADRPLFLVSDEVYEHITFDGRPHVSLMQHPVLRERTFVIGSFGKTFHITGWKVGYCLAPASLTTEFRKIHQFLTFSVSTPMQFALADYLKDPAPYQTLPAFYERKRDLFLEALSGSPFGIIPSEGTFFQNLSYAAITGEPDQALAERLTREIGVASIPVSVFYHRRDDHKILRFCFAKEDTVLRQAGNRLVAWANRVGGSSSLNPQSEYELH